MARVKQLVVYPIKSCRGIDATTSGAMITRTGFLYDRQWMVVEDSGDSGDKPKRMITQRKYPALARVRVSISRPEALVENLEDAELVVSVGDPSASQELRVPLHPSSQLSGQVSVWEWAGPAIDCGSEAASFFSSVTKTPCRLVRFPSSNESGIHRATDGDYAPSSETAFSDGFPYLVATQESLDAVNKEANDAGLSMDRFRANIVLEGAGAAFEEDRWASVILGEGEDELLFDLVKPCSRCTITTVDQNKGEVTGREPLVALNRIHNGAKAGYERAGFPKKWDRVPFFGWNAICDDALVGRVVRGGTSVRTVDRT